MHDSGKVYTDIIGNFGARVYLSWSVSEVNESTGRAKFSYELYIDGSDTVFYHLNGSNYCKLNGNDIYRVTNYGDGNSNNPFIAYGKKDSDLGHNYVRYGSTSDWGDFYGKYVIVYGKLASGNFDIYYNDNGNVSVSLVGNFSCSGGSKSFNTPIIPKSIDRYSHSRNSTNKGASWPDANKKRFWKTTNYGRPGSWQKCNAYYLYNNGRDKSKIV